MQVIKHQKPVAAILASTKVPTAPIRSSIVMDLATPILDISFPPNHMVAQANSWHVNRYYYQAAENQWYVVESAVMRNRISTFILRAVDEEDGRPVGMQVTTSGDLWADRFADRPFNVREFLNGRLPPTEDWFKSLVANRDVFQQLELYDKYNDRLRYCSSFEALVRLGIVPA